MKLLKVIGAILIFAAGYLGHIIIASDWDFTGKVYATLGILFLIHIGAAAMLARNSKSFKKSLVEALAWPLRGL